MKNKILIHNILIGIILLSIPIISSPDFYRGFSLFAFKPFLQNFSSYFILVLFLFFHYYLLIPKLYKNQKIILYTLSVIVFLFIMIFLPKFIINASPPPREDLMNHINTTDKKNIIFNIINFNDGLFFQFILIWLFTLSTNTKKKLEEIKNEKLVIENTYLKSQINSHFLFNTLNNIYALSLTKPKQAPLAILKLSDLMRYVITVSNTKKVKLEDELTYIKNYIELQKLKINELVSVNLIINHDDSDHIITPIILINFIENAFKYGVNTEKASNICIDILVQKNTLKLYVKNDLVVTKGMYKNSTKQGIKNTKKRLNSTYNNKYKLTLNKTKNTFETTLIINLK